ELQMLHGMAGPLPEAFVALGHRVRIYTPVGQLLPGMAYLVRRLLENTAHDSFLRASFTEHVPEEHLLMNPQPQASGPPPNGNPDAAETSEVSEAFGSLSSRRAAWTTFRNEPLTDFRRDDARRAMQQALDDVGHQLGGSYPLVIANQSVPTEQWIDSVNPSH